MCARISHVHVAVDIGASSGRVLAGWIDRDTIQLREIYRFPNALRRKHGHDCWDVSMLFESMLTGLAMCRDQGMTPSSVGIDTWGCDYVLLDDQGTMVGDAISYRDTRTESIFDLADKTLPPRALYAETGIQRQPFNTVYQLMAHKREQPEAFEQAARFLTIPDYLVWRLTGKQVNEYTVASTTGLLEVTKRTWDERILKAIDVPNRLFSKPHMPGAIVGDLLPDIQRRVGFDAHVVLPASHDTASAFLAVPAQEERSVFLSSGTWSLMGIESETPFLSEEARHGNFTNEGGHGGRYRVLKNIMGLWMIQSVRRELNGDAYIAGRDNTQNVVSCPSATQPRVNGRWEFGDLIDLARDAEPFSAFVDVESAAFLAPCSMLRAVREACSSTGQAIPTTTGEVMRTIYLSLARAYASCAKDIEHMTKQPVRAIHVTGGGSQDAYLNQLTADACNVPVIAGPTEGTGLGNLVVQMLATGELGSVAEARRTIARSFPLTTFHPTN